MSLRTSVDYEIQAGQDNSLDNLVFSTSRQELLDSLENDTSESGSLDAGETDRAIDFGDIVQARLIYIEADGDVDVEFGGGAATGAAVTGVGASYPTGFLGGEILGIASIDGVAVSVAFLVADQTLQQVVNRINSEAALLAVPNIASIVGGQLVVTSPTTGLSSVVTITASAVATALGFTGGATDTGVNANPGTSKIRLSQAVDPASSQVEDTKAFAILAMKTNSMTLTNVSTTVALNFQVAIFGDLTPITC